MSERTVPTRSSIALTLAQVHPQTANSTSSVPARPVAAHSTLADMMASVLYSSRCDLRQAHLKADCTEQQDCHGLNPVGTFEEDEAAEMASILKAIQKVASFCPLRSSSQLSSVLPAMQLRNAIELLSDHCSITPLEGEIEEALDILHDEAIRNDPLAQTCLAGLYRRGLHVPCDLSLSLYWLHRAAVLHDRCALLQLARMHTEGVHGLQAHMGKAMAYYNRAALDGCTESQYALAMLHLHGGPDGSSPRPCLGGAVRWLEKAALGGLPEAQYQLGALYRKTPIINLRLARYWLSKAAQGGNEDAERAVGAMLIKVTGVARMWLLDGSG